MSEDYEVHPDRSVNCFECNELVDERYTIRLEECGEICRDCMEKHRRRRG